MAATAVADQVDDDVALELHPIVDGKLGDEQHRLGIVSVHMEDRRLDHLRHVGRILGGASIFLLVGGEADLVVDHDADGAASAVGTGLRHLEGFHHDTLTGDSCVTVDGDRQDLVANRVVATILAGTYGTLDHRRNDLQVRRVERHGQVDLAARGHHVGRETLVILDVTGAQAFDLLAFELVEQIARVLAEGIDQHVQTAAVGHADDDFLGTVGAGALDDLVEQRNQALATFQAETLGTRILGTQVLLQTFGSGKTLEQMALDLRRKLRTATHAFQALDEPAALLGIDDVHVFRADGAAIGFLQSVDDFAQSGLAVDHGQVTGAEHGVEISVGQTVIVDRQIGGCGALLQAKRIELCCLMAAHSVGLDQAQDFNLLLLMLAADSACGYRLSTALVLGQQDEVVADRRMRYIG